MKHVNKYLVLSIFLVYEKLKIFRISIPKYQILFIGSASSINCLFLHCNSLLPVQTPLSFHPTEPLGIWTKGGS